MHRLDQPLAAQLAALEVVGGDEADVVAALQPGIEDHDRDLPSRRVATGPASAASSSGASTMPGDAARDEAFDLGHLRVAIVFAQRPAPDHLGAQLLGGTIGAGMNALPEHVRRALRDDRNRQRRGAGGLRAVLCAGRRRNEQAGSRPANHRVMHNASLQEEVSP